MLIKRKRGWELPESAATPESVYMNRCNLLKSLGAGSILLGGAPGLAFAATEAADPSASLYPVKRNEKFKLDRAITDEKYVTTYNNFYEFGSSKTIAQAAQKLPVRPWTIAIDGMVEKPMTVDIDTLLKAMPLEELLYRHRCVEAWSIAIPWSGFPMRSLVEYAKPLSSAKYVRMLTFLDKSFAPGQKQFWYPWPYEEGLTMAEANNELAFLVTGLYGKPVAKPNGAPLRLAVPWKYGFKSVKSIVRFEFTDKRPKTFWEALQASEYGFWANVNPEVPHPRWSQAQETVLGTGEKVPTQLFNGYGEYVADIYKDMKDERLYI